MKREMGYKIMQNHAKDYQIRGNKMRAGVEWRQN